MKRHRVRLRPKVRTRRRAFGRTLLVGLALAAGGLAVARARPWRGLAERVGPFPWPDAVRVEAVEVLGAPAGLEHRMRVALDFRPGEVWAPWRPGRVAGELRRRFACLRSVRARREWLSRRVVFETELRTPVARVSRGGAASGLLDAEGEAFAAPEGLYAEGGLPVLDLSGHPADRGLGPLGRLVAAAAAPGALPVRLKGMRYEASEDGWSAALEDGTTLLWGSLRWTDEKLSRLREVFSDARPRFPGGLTADLRSFEDGKIFVRPN